MEVLEFRTLLAAIDLGSSAYLQNFDSLALTGSPVTVANGEFTGGINGWYFVKNNVASASAAYGVGNGSGNMGDVYSYGVANDADRALGGLRSGSVNPTFGAQFRNGNSTVITQLDISYVGEQWRLGAIGRTDRIDFQYSVDATSLTTGTWTDFNSMDFSAPVTAGTVGALNGNAAANRASVSATITGLNLAAGTTFWIRWTDFDATVADDGLAVDDFSITATSVSAGGGSEIFINEVVFDAVPQSDTGEEYIELRGTPNAFVPVDAYLVLVEGDSESGAGSIDHVFNIGGMQFGSNGFLVLRQFGSTYSVNSAATIVTATSSGWGATWSSRSIDIENGSVTVMVIQSALAPVPGTDVDVNNDGELDGVAANWTIYDALGNIDGGASDTAYGFFNTSGNGQGRVPQGSTFINLNGYHPDYMGRIGNSTGRQASDWVAAELAGSMPNVTLATAGFTRPANLEGATLNHIGSVNVFSSAGDTTPPTVVSIDDGHAGNVVLVGNSLTYTITFSEDINEATVFATNFDNAGTATVVIGVINEASPGVFRVVVTPTSSGTLRLRIRDTAAISDVAGNRLVLPVSDDTVLAVNAATQLGVADGAILGFRADPAKGFSFVTWVDLLPGTTINFWDSGYLGGGDGTGRGANGGDWRASEGLLTWTNSTGSTLLGGTVIVIGNLPSIAPTADVGSVSGTTTFDLSASGDQIFMGQGSFVPGSSPSTFNGTLIYGFDYNGAVGWDAAATNANTSALPGVLSVSTANFTVAPNDNGQYTGLRSFASIHDAKAAIQLLNNYTLEDTGSTVLDSQNFTFAPALVDFVIVQRDGSTTVFENGNPGAIGVLGRTDTFTVVLSAQPTSNVVLNVTSADTGEATTSPATLTFTSLNWNTPQTVIVTGVFDNLADGNQPVDVTVAVDDSLSDNTFDPLADQIVAVTVEDTPNRPTVTGITGGTTTTPTLQFGDVTGETGYTVVVINISVSPAVEVFRDSTIAQDSTNYQIPVSAGLQSNRTYRAFLFATNGANSYSLAGGITSPQFVFTQFTVGGAPVTPPAKPVANSVSGSPTQRTISWPAASNPSADFYSVYLINLVTNAVVQSTTGIATNSFIPTNTIADGRYRIWVSATNAAGDSGFGAPFDFTLGTPIVVPTPPTGIAANGSNPPTVSWTASPGATTYSVYLINRATNAVIASTRGLTAANFTPVTTLADGPYRIWVSATNGAGTSAFSAPRDFSVGAPLSAPTVPTGLAVTGLNTTQPTISWNAVASATSYAVWFINRDTGVLISAATNITTTSFTPSSPLTLGGNYRIWVRASNAVGTSAFSSPLDFKIND